jgi:hypothetical protein
MVKGKAYNALTGKLIWEYDPQVPGETAVKACCDVVNRGMGAWGDKLFYGTLDGRLIALDRTTGRLLWSTVTVDRTKPYTITARRALSTAWSSSAMAARKWACAGLSRAMTSTPASSSGNSIPFPISRQEQGSLSEARRGDVEGRVVEAGRGRHGLGFDGL